MTPETILRDALRDAAVAMGAPDDFQPQLERPRDPSFGDWASNAAMLLARHLKRKPLEIAQDLVARLDVAKAGVSEAYVAGAGFINFRLAAGAEAQALVGLLAAGSTYGRSDEGGRRVVNVEFVSANPTGPLHVGHGRQAALGDAISTLLEWTGWAVTREFYYNDAGVQIANLGRSVQARVREVTTGVGDIPEGGYHGEYIREIAREYVAQHPQDAQGDDLEAIRAFAVAYLRGEQDKDLQAFGVKFDVYYLESSLYSDGKVDETVQMLTAAGQTFEKDGALWLRTTDYGDDKDRVMRKSDGSYTYFLPDVAYHLAKWRRGFSRAIDVQGADHHSTVTRVRAGLQALGMGIPAGYPEYELHQMVTVMKGGEEVKISKRAGSYVTVRDLIDEVGRDAVRYFLLMRKSDSQLVFDVDVARAQSEENPVYYIQMAHARVCGIFRVGEVDATTITGAGVDWSALAEDDERELVKALLGFPALVTAAARTLAPHLVASYLLETARLVHTWYHKHHVLGEPEPIRSARLALARAAQVTLANGLAMLGITAPERM
ncbi:MAG: arginine--tRNA ligase [Gemmatimonadetes bacterium]|jgi:arginyl-tRNA synthetase|nr:arginine--tRNA ligase [Gemmatimonadota bacterium]HNV74235.1 arginine--tRNA ligase [Gemmatimonadaceae bacterium]MBK7835908.1 arginine--tRNA ligase [Gemmatimonadota bacterium]MBK8645952.1 arginine--tRNA ligase [Gemmatimonadota bacterium]MBK9407911.1 arginine--tRNA ligase [Gemmatimonadota bacterium]